MKNKPKKWAELSHCRIVRADNGMGRNDLEPKQPSTENTVTELYSANYLFPVLSYDTSGKMASQSTGIQQLLAAEKRAAEKVAEARKSK